MGCYDGWEDRNTMASLGEGKQIRGGTALKPSQTYLKFQDWPI